MPRGHSLPGPLSQAQEFTSLPAPCCQGVWPCLPSALQPPVLRGRPWGALQGSSSYLGGVQRTLQRPSSSISLPALPTAGPQGCS